MKNIYILLILLFFSSGLLFSQVGVNTDGTSPHNSAMLDVKSDNSGFLPPRMTIVQRDAIPAPAEGLMVFCTDCGYNDSSAMSIYINGMWRLMDNDAQSNNWTCGSSITINHVAGSVAPVSKTVTYGTVSNIPGEPSKCWITSNLGADHQALAVNDATEASAGWYWQFNLMQGYQHTGTERTPNTAWIGDHPENSDWIPAHDPCALELGSGWHVPAFSEWYNVDANTGGNWNTWNDAWNSGLKLHGAGYLAFWDGSLFYRGVHGYYWSSTQYDNGGSYYLDFDGGNCYPGGTGKVYGLTVRCTRAAAPTLTTANITDITQNTATCGGNITTDGGAEITARGVCWSTLSGPTTADSHTTDGSGTGVFTSNITSLSANTTYHVRAYATNSLGTTYGNEVGFTTLPWSCGSTITVNHLAGAVSPVTKTVTYGTVTGIPGEPSKCWITNNLGADHQATAKDDATEESAGWYWQFNRMQGYKHTGTTRTPNYTWITPISEAFDWQPANDPCNLELGNGWRIPTSTEWIHVDASGNWYDWTGPWTSALKLHAAGDLLGSSGSLENRGFSGLYGSSSQSNNTFALQLYFLSNYSFVQNYNLKTYGFSLRCIRE
jgi:hypothetical protein